MSRAGHGPGAASAPGTAGDLLLAPEQVRVSEALSHFAWGRFLQLDGADAAEAYRRHFLEALRLEPESEPLLTHFLAAHPSRREFGKVAELLAPIAAQHPGAVHIQLALSEALAADKKLPEAIKVLEAAVSEADWSAPLLLRQLFVYYWQAKRYDDVRSLLGRARRRSALRNHFVVLHAAAMYYQALSRLPEHRRDERRKKRYERRALSYGRKAVKRIEQLERAADAESLAALFISLDAPEEAKAALVKAYAQLGGDSLELGLLFAECLQDAGETVQAEEILDDVRNRALVHPQALVELGRLYFASGRLEKAAHAYERALFLQPRFSSLRISLGYLFLRLGEPGKCVETVDKLPKMTAEGHLLRSHAYRDLGKLDEAAREIALAEAAAKKTISLAEGDAKKARSDAFFNIDFYLYYAALCEDMGFYDRAIERVRKAVEIAPRDPVCANFLGYVLADHDRDLEEAEKWVDLALEAEPDNVAYVDSIAWVYYRQERFAEALVEINRCLRLGGREADPVILDHAGDIYLANSLLLLARRYWWEALAEGPKEKDAARIREKLREHGGPDGPPSVPGVDTPPGPAS